ncbi:uncharacterized protein PSFLO_03395 [Pseudozyma flocculosa]|uniref:Uncharacterized protein n=1 Tax=Pseudozyma flocculosa TaxID=84751 RepID=A0A5C3F0F1_9BASI|nr:uncharacterized protein PSFLO_03395 [Pseudozyma flocculosa]
MARAEATTERDAMLEIQGGVRRRQTLLCPGPPPPRPRARGRWLVVAVVVMTAWPDRRLAGSRSESGKPAFLAVVAVVVVVVCAASLVVDAHALCSVVVALCLLSAAAGSARRVKQRLVGKAAPRSGATETLEPMNRDLGIGRRETHCTDPQPDGMPVIEHPLWCLCCAALHAQSPSLLRYRLAPIPGRLLWQCRAWQGWHRWPRGARVAAYGPQPIQPSATARSSQALPADGTTVGSTVGGNRRRRLAPGYVSNVESAAKSGCRRAATLRRSTGFENFVKLQV